MRLEKITATPHPAGNRIDLAWVNPDPEAYPHVRVVRRERTHPTSLEDGVVVPLFSLDLGFQGELDDPGEQPSPALRQHSSSWPMERSCNARRWEEAASRSRATRPRLAWLTSATGSPVRTSRSSTRSMLL